MVEKRTLAFATLALIVWASTATTLASYYYIQSQNYQSQSSEKQHSLDNVASDYNQLVAKWNSLAGEYSGLHGNYQYFSLNSWFKGENCTIFLNSYTQLLLCLKGNYSDLLNSQHDLNGTYAALLNQTQTLQQQTTITEEEFERSLNEFHSLLASLAMKELGNSIGNAVTLKVNLCIDYGNGTTTWYNNTSILSGSTLFDLTQKVATVEYTYYANMEPGHMLIGSINGWMQGWWLWYYWDAEKGEWTFGPVGCDAWMLKDGGIYKWHCSP